MGKKTIQTMNLKDIPEQYHYIAQEIGVEPFMKLCKVAGGGPMYIPKLETTKRELRNREIVNKYKYEGFSVKDLSDKYDLSGSQVRRIIEEGF